MWLIEGALEVHLGEFHIRMKGNRAESGWAEGGLGGAPGLLGGPGTSAEGGGLVRIPGVPAKPWVSTHGTCDLSRVPSPELDTRAQSCPLSILMIYPSLKRTPSWAGDPPVRACGPWGRGRTGQRGDEPVSVFQAWWATHASVPETSMRYGHLHCQASGSPTRPLGVGSCWEPGSQPGFCLHPPLASREGPQAGGKGECLPGAADLALVGPCPQVLMRLGRQRWKLKGRIESDDSQTWEEEEKAFIPTLHENFEIKVGGAWEAGRGRGVQGLSSDTIHNSHPPGDRAEGPEFTGSGLGDVRHH